MLRWRSEILLVNIIGKGSLAGVSGMPALWNGVWCLIPTGSVPAAFYPRCFSSQIEILKADLNYRR